MNHFVLDANTVIAEQYGASAHMRALLSASSAVGFQVHLPKVALEEIAARYERELSKNTKEGRPKSIETVLVIGSVYRFPRGGVRFQGRNKSISREVAEPSG